MDSVNNVDIDLILNAVDKNLDGYVDYEEFITATLDLKKELHMKKLEMAFDLYDADKNGTISI